MNLKRIIKLEFGIPVIRSILKRIYKEGKFYKVRLGKLKGLYFYYRRDINFHALIGLSDTENIEALDKAIKKLGLNTRDIVIADVGANMGYYSMYFAKYFSPKSRIYAFEPSISILDVLKKNIAINHFENVKIIEAACSYGVGSVQFYISENHHASSMINQWENDSSSAKIATVNTISLDGFFENEPEGQYPDLIKMDIEGAGVYALKGCEHCLAAKRPLMLIESHTGPEDDAIGYVLRNFHYEALRIETNKWVLYKDRNYEDLDGVYGKMLLIPSEKMHEYKS
jgi:FkbM family methyltransferase